MTLEQVSRWSFADLSEDIAKGGKFVYFTYAISLLIITFKRPSKVFYIPSNSSPISHGWVYLLISFLLGWWGIPWGPIYTVQSIYYAFVGYDVTGEVLKSLTK